MIRIPQVRVVDEEGEQLGVMPTPQALEMAQERGYDLVEVAPMASPPVARFLDFGQYKYELTKREKEAKRKQRSVTFKEVRLKPKIGIGDFDTKVRRAIEFLEDGDRIKVAVQFRGRELTHPEIGRALLEKFSDKIKDHGVIERAPLLEGKSMHITVASVHKPKVIERDRQGRTTDPAAPIDGRRRRLRPKHRRPPPRHRHRPPSAAPAAAAPAPATDASARTDHRTSRRGQRPGSDRRPRTDRSRSPEATNASEARRSAQGARAGTHRRVRPRCPR